MGARRGHRSGFLGQASPSRPRRRLDSGPSAAKRQAEQPERVRQLIIVANRGHLYEYFKQAFAGNETVRVLLNRRVVERRARYGPYAVERRAGDRRSARKIDAQLDDLLKENPDAYYGFKERNPNMERWHEGAQ